MSARDRPLRWTCVLDTADPEAPPIDFAHGSVFLLQARSVAVLRASYAPMVSNDETALSHGTISGRTASGA